MDDLEWSKETEITIKATVAGSYRSRKRRRQSNLQQSWQSLNSIRSEAGDVSGLEESYQQDLERTVIWAGVIKILVVDLTGRISGDGLITFSFYAVSCGRTGSSE